MDVLLWSCFNYVVGSFPLFLMRENDNIRFTKCSLWFVFLILNVAASCNMFYSVCQLYNFPSVELQKYRCYLAWFVNIIVLLRRLLFGKSIEELFRCVLSVFSCGSFFSDSKHMIILQVIIAFIKYIGVVWSAPKTLFMKIGLIINYVYILGPVFIDSQCIIICYTISDELDQLNVFVTHRIKSIQDLEKFKINLRRCEKSTFTWRVVLLKTIFYAAFFAGLFASVSWFCIKADGVASKIKAISHSLYKMNYQTAEEKLRVEILLLADQLENYSFSVMGFGFFTVNIRFIFKGFATAMSMIVLFVQLAHMRYQQESLQKSN